ncbi:alginate export family protein [Chitinophaga sp. sic0106]|uniref:alginate export family protein n=1 Tax=Chitinophaga sp. sic0106 TaxID=2854785 RepID=UPI001C45FF33|nr:alginate export family protein [Chitinophaga sp. sic0106]MBV7530297.1 alginate export family protein [Chitinophaga sp. sic0106]
MKKLFLSGASFVLSGLFLRPAYAQLSINAQLRTRSEFRDGQGAPLPANAKPAFFTSQRSRLSAGFNTYRLQLGLTVQDVRVWGQDASTINRTTTADNNGFLLHEAWAAVMLTDTTVKNFTLSLKAGRQELVYDDSRLLGNLDWLQQGRRHDAVLLRYQSARWQLHFGAAFNQNKENGSGTIYNPTPPGNYAANTNGGSMYKSLEFLHASRKTGAQTLSFLVLADQFSRSHTDTVNNLPVKTWEATTTSRITAGLYWNRQSKLLETTAAGYFQAATNPSYLLSAQVLFKASSTFSVGPGVDYTSPWFDPLYGTPHKFWGNMDYFYVASTFGRQGLQDYYLKSRWKPSAKWILNADLHQFFSAGTIAGYPKNFGTEADITATYSLTRIISIEGGYSHYWSTNTLTSPTVKNIANSSSNSNWAYLMLTVKPEIFIK